MRRLDLFCALALLLAGCSSSNDETSPADDTRAGGGTNSGTGGNEMQVGGAGESSTTTAPGGALGGGGSAGRGGSPGGTAGTVGVDGGKAGASGTMDAGGLASPPDAGAPRPCNHLAAAGRWENISPVKTAFDTSNGHNFADAIVVDPFDAATVWHGTGYAGLFKSTDCGATFVRVNTGRNADALQGSALGSMAVDPVNPGVMYTTAFDGANGLFKSSNGGVDWDQLLPPSSNVAKAVDGNVVNSVAMDPRDPRHLVIGMHANCLAPLGAVCEAESIDAGATWTLTTVPVPGQGWAPGAGAFILGATSWLFGTYSSGLWLTTDRGATWSNVTPSGGSGSTAGKTICVPFYPNLVDGRYYLPAMEGILRSTSGDGRTWSLLPNSGGRSVGFAMGGGYMYSADQWSTTYHVASESDSTKWSTLPGQPSAALPTNLGAPYLAYDPAHHVLYSANFAGGLWRVVTP